MVDPRKHGLKRISTHPGIMSAWSCDCGSVGYCRARGSRPLAALAKDAWSRHVTEARMDEELRKEQEARDAADK